MNSKGRMIVLAILAVLVAVALLAPSRTLSFIHNVLALSNVALFLFAAAVLVWFLYAVILRRILRARRIANARMRRMMREAGDNQPPR